MTHRVTVATRLEDEGTPDERRYVDRVTLTCDAVPEANCRMYPDCDCEGWPCEHERIPGQECVLKGWFDAEGAVYAGNDYDDMRDDCVPAVDRSGPIEVKWLDEWPEWTFIFPKVAES